METKVREDPMLAIKRREKEQLQAIINNPMKMIMLKKMVTLSCLMMMMTGQVDKEKKEKHHGDRSRKHRSPSPSPDKRRTQTSPRHRSRSPRRRRSRSPRHHRRSRSPHGKRSRSPARTNRRRSQSKSPVNISRPHSIPSRSVHRRSRTTSMTEEEKQRKLAEMAQDADNLRQSRIERAQAGLALEAKEKSELTGDARFLRYAIQRASVRLSDLAF